MTRTTASADLAPELYTIDEAAAMLRLGRTVIGEQLRAGRLRSVRQGRARRIPAAAIDEYVALLEREARQERGRADPELRVADTRADSTPDTGRTQDTDTGEDTTPDAEAVVAVLWPLAAVMLARDVEARGGGRYRGRVRWKDPATGRYRGHSRTFGSQTAAWAWVRTWTAPPIAVAARDGSGTA